MTINEVQFASNFLFNLDLLSGICHVSFSGSSHQWTWLITVSRVGGCIDTAGVLIFNLALARLVGVQFMKTSASVEHISICVRVCVCINCKPNGRQRRLSIMSSSERRSTAAWRDPPGTQRPLWQLPPRGTANYGHCRFNGVPENKEVQVPLV